eukprot:9158933-Pyramimonas_sp.AAC.1
MAQFRCARRLAAAAGPMSRGTPTRSLKYAKHASSCLQAWHQGVTEVPVSKRSVQKYSSTVVQRYSTHTACCAYPRARHRQVVSPNVPEREPITEGEESIFLMWEPITGGEESIFLMWEPITGGEPNSPAVKRRLEGLTDNSRLGRLFGARVYFGEIVLGNRTLQWWSGVTRA